MRRMVGSPSVLVLHGKQGIAVVAISSFLKEKCILRSPLCL